MRVENDSVKRRWNWRSGVERMRNYDEVGICPRDGNDSHIYSFKLGYGPCSFLEGN